MQYLPCPFCGGSKLDVYSDRFIICADCGGEGKASLWNNRRTGKEKAVCLAGNEENMIKTLNALADARLQFKQWTDAADVVSEQRTIEVSYSEGLDVLSNRIATLELKCRELGIHGPAPKADPGDQRRIVDAR